MTSARLLVLRGEPYLTLEHAAECYSLEVAFVREVYAQGLLGPGEPAGETIAIPAPLLDRLALIVRLTRHHGLDLDLVAVLLDDLE